MVSLLPLQLMVEPIAAYIQSGTARVSLAAQAKRESGREMPSDLYDMSEVSHAAHMVQ